MPTYKNISTKPIVIDKKVIDPNETVSTLKIYDSPDLQKISDDPYYPLAYAVHEVEATEAGVTPSEGISLQRKDCKAIRVTATTSVDIYANTLSNPYKYPLNAGETIDIRNNYNIEKILLDFKSAGKVTLIEIPEMEE